MAAPRLPFLWPMLFAPTKAARGSNLRLRENTALGARRPRRSCRQFATTSRAHEEATSQRYGKAFEPAPHLRNDSTPQEPEAKSNDDALPEPPHNEPDEDEAPKPTATSTPSTPSKPSAINTEPTTIPPTAPTETAEKKPLDSVLHMPSPQDADHHKPPHLKTPPYVHHFDTYGLVRALTHATYTPAASSTLMKAVRSLLISNLELARAGLVSKSNVENESYLFRAACSELKTEIESMRKGGSERMRVERAQLQHEVDILGQRMGQETGGLRDEVKGLFDDRKMGVRMEQRGMETKIQELNYKITVALNSDARSEVEGVRWVLTRRAAITVGVSAFMLFVALRYTSYVQHQQQEERRKMLKAPPPSDGDASPKSNVEVVSRPEVLGSELLAGEGVSLG